MVFIFLCCIYDYIIIWFVLSRVRSNISTMKILKILHIHTISTDRGIRFSEEIEFFSFLQSNRDFLFLFTLLTNGFSLLIENSLQFKMKQSQSLNTASAQRPNFMHTTNQNVLYFVLYTAKEIDWFKNENEREKFNN